MSGLLFADVPLRNYSLTCRIILAAVCVYVYYINLQCVASKVGLPPQYLYYFGMCLVCKAPDADYSCIMLFFVHILNN